MKQVLAFFIAVLALTACTNSTNEGKQGTALEQFTDSITKARPNYEGNIAVQKMIGEEFSKNLGTLPGVLDGTAFKVVELADIAGKTMVMFSSDNPIVYLWSEDYGTENAAKLDKAKTYRITGGTLDRYEPVEGVASPLLKLGSIYVRDLTMEEI